MTWQTTYPTVATVQAANYDTVRTWCEQLPKPQTDVERTVHRRLILRREQLLAEQVRAQHPDLADAYNRMCDNLEKIVGAGTMRRM